MPTQDLLLCFRRTEPHWWCLQCVLQSLMDPNQTRRVQQPWVLILLSQEQALSLLALSHRYCFVGNAAEQNYFQYLSLYFVVLVLISHMYNIAGGETPQ